MASILILILAEGAMEAWAVLETGKGRGDSGASGGVFGAAMPAGDVEEAVLKLGKAMK